MSLEVVNGAAELEEDGASPTPSPRPSPSPPRPRIPFFHSPEAEEELTSPTPSPDQPGDGSASAGEEPTDPDGSPEETGPPASSADGLLSKKQLKDTFRAGVSVSTTTAHRLAARTPGQQHVGLYLADDDDVRGIGDPLAEIAYRRGGLAGGQLSPDSNNALQAVMALAGYIAKQIRGVQEARVIDGQIRAGVHPGTSDAGEVA